MNPKLHCLAVVIGFATVHAFVSPSFGAAAKPPKPPAPGKASDTRVPDSAYGVYTMADAAAEAAKKKKPVTYIITDQQPDEPAVMKGTNKAYWMLQDDSVVVVLRNSTAGEWPKRLPETAVKFVKAPELGKEYPKLVVMNDDSTVALAGMTAGKIIGMDEKELDKFGKEIKKLNVGKEVSADHPPPNPEAKPAPAKSPGKADAPPVPAPASGPVAIKNPQAEAWTNAEGRVIQAALVEVNGASIVFDMGGSKVPYDVSKLSEASKKRVEQLRAANAK